MMFLSLFQDKAAWIKMRYTERGWTNNGSQEEGQEESSQEESHQKEVVFILQSQEWDRRGHEGPRRILSPNRPARAELQECRKIIASVRFF